MYTGLEIAKALGCTPESTTVSFSFRWKGLNDRKLSNWANPNYDVFGEQNSVQDSVTASADIPLDASNELIYNSLHKIVNKVFNLFSGFEVGPEAIRILTDKLRNRTLL